jgi:hypothetical protein
LSLGPVPLANRRRLPASFGDQSPEDWLVVIRAIGQSILARSVHEAGPSVLTIDPIPAPGVPPRLFALVSPDPIAAFDPFDSRR